MSGFRSGQKCSVWHPERDFTGRVFRASPGQAWVDGPFGSGTAAGVPLANTVEWRG